jgi:outer membrane protein assembly factor BamB
MVMCCLVDVCLRMAVLFLPAADAALPAPESCWPRFRGPNGTGVSPAVALPVPWTDKDYRWRVKLPGVGYSSPVVWADRLFVTSAIEKASPEKDGTQIISCLRTSDGGTVWRREFPARTYPKNALNSFASSTPAVDAQRLYVSWATPENYLVAALDSASGREVWRHDLGPFQAEHGFGTSPILFEDLVILANEQNGPSSIVALDRATGKVRWTAPRRTERAAYSTPCLYQPEGGPVQLIATSWAHGIASLDPKTGQANWELPAIRFRVVSSPVAAGGLIFAAAGTGGTGKQFLAVRPPAPGKNMKPELAYEIKTSLPYVPTSVADQDQRHLFLFGDQGVFTCIEIATGEVRWRERVGGRFFASPVRVGDRLFCVSTEGQVVVLAAAAQFKLLGRVDLGEPSKSTPAIAGGVMYLRTASQVMAVGKPGPRQSSRPPLVGHTTGMLVGRRWFDMAGGLIRMNEGGLR